MLKPPLALLVLAGLAIGPAVVVQAWEPAAWDPTKAEPAVAYGTLPGFPLPKTILFSIGPDEILADAREWQRHGVSAFFLDFVARDWSSDIWATDGEPWTIGASDKTLQKTKQATAVTPGTVSYHLDFDPDRWGNMRCVTDGETNGPCSNWTFDTTKNRINTSGFTYDSAGNVTADGIASLSRTYWVKSIALTENP